MKTHFPRERGIESGAGKQSTLVCPRVSLAEGIRITIQFIHSRPFTYLPLYPHSSYTFYHCLHLLTPSTFRGKPTNHAPSLAHNHSTFMEMCVIAVRYTTRWTWKDTTNKRTGFGVGSSILHTTIDSLYNKCLCEARRHRLCLTTSTIMYYTHLIR